MLKFFERHKWLRFFVILSLVMLGGAGMVAKKQHDFKQEMISEVKKHKDVADKALKALDHFDKVKTVTIDYDTVHHSPMGGIIFAGYVNDNKKLEFEYNLDKSYVGGLEEYSVSGRISSELDDFMCEEDNNGE